MPAPAAAPHRPSAGSQRCPRPSQRAGQVWQRRRRFDAPLGSVPIARSGREGAREAARAPWRRGQCESPVHAPRLPLPRHGAVGGDDVIPVLRHRLGSRRPARSARHSGQEPSFARFDIRGARREAERPSLASFDMKGCAERACDMSNRAKLGLSAPLGHPIHVKARQTWLSGPSTPFPRLAGGGVARPARSLRSAEWARHCRAWRPAAPGLLGRLSPKPQGLASLAPHAVPQPPSGLRRQRRGPPGEDCAGRRLTRQSARPS